MLALLLFIPQTLMCGHIWNLFIKNRKVDNLQTFKLKTIDDFNGSHLATIIGECLAIMWAYIIIILYNDYPKYGLILSFVFEVSIISQLLISNGLWYSLVKKKCKLFLPEIKWNNWIDLCCCWIPFISMFIIFFKTRKYTKKEIMKNDIERN